MKAINKQPAWHRHYGVGAGAECVKAKKHKMTSTISIISICIAIVGVIISSLNLRFMIVNEYDTGTAFTMLFCMITILFGNLTIFLLSIKKYKDSTK